LTRQKLERDQVQERETANQVHFDMGRRVRNTIIEAGATLPEELPTPQKSVQQLQQEEQQRLKQGPQLPLFPSEEK
jgi:DNA-damage-inducible protein D